MLINKSINVPPASMAHWHIFCIKTSELRFYQCALKFSTKLRTSNNAPKSLLTHSMEHYSH